jgi:hypothetical protein
MAKTGKPQMIVVNKKGGKGPEGMYPRKRGKGKREKLYGAGKFSHMENFSM